MRLKQTSHPILVGLFIGFLIKVIENNFPSFQAKFVTLLTPGKVPIMKPKPIGWNDITYILLGAAIAIKHRELGLAIIAGWFLHQSGEWFLNKPLGSYSFAGIRL